MAEERLASAVDRLPADVDAVTNRPMNAAHLLKVRLLPATYGYVCWVIRVGLVVSVLLLLGLPSEATAKAVKCQGDPETVSNGQARFTCEASRLRRGEAVEFVKRPDCGRLRDFTAMHTSYARLGGYAVRRLPKSSFELRDTGSDLEGDEEVRLRVTVRITRRVIRFTNRGTHLVEVSFSERCPIR